MIRLTRRYHFPAAHVLSHPSFSAERNWEIYGKCANPNSHGHNYRVEVTVAGPVDERSGRVIDPKRLDEIFRERILARFAYRLLNEDELFAQQVPTAENVAAVIYERLSGPLAALGPARLRRVRVVETHRNSFSYGAAE